VILHVHKLNALNSWMHLFVREFNVT